ncbi:O-methyltransferase [Rothia sp. P5766]|uniref:O-methyltransferase n=1 Tax=Rothia sp. P5766 TaxID=3402656 RepID=UPI003AE06BDA
MKSHDLARNWVYAEDFPREVPVLELAREQAERLDAAPVAPSVAALLTILAATGKAQHTVEIGCGAGVSTVALLSGLPAGTSLTTIDIDATRSQAVRSLLSATGLEQSHRVRVITGDALQVLPRLSPGSYDLALVDAGPELADQLVLNALALLASGGLLILHDPLAGGAVASPTDRDGVTVTLRSVLHDIAACTEDVFVSLLYVGSGLYLIYKK